MLLERVCYRSQHVQTCTSGSPCADGHCPSSANSWASRLFPPNLGSGKLRRPPGDAARPGEGARPGPGLAGDEPLCELPGLAAPWLNGMQNFSPRSVGPSDNGLAGDPLFLAFRNAS